MAVGVIGLLVALTVPAIRAARVAAEERIALANIRSAAGDIDHHAAQRDDVYPRILPDVWYQTNYGGGYSAMQPGSRWAADWLWPAIIRETAPWEEHIQSWMSGSDRVEPGGDGGFMPAFRYSHSFVAPGSLWTPEGAAEAARNPRAFDGPVRRAEVATPAGKVILFDPWMPYRGRGRVPRSQGMPTIPMPAAFADGHAKLVLASEATAPFPNPLNDDRWSRLVPFHNTPGGVRGRDY